jgi:hypothetical protein
MRRSIPKRPILTIYVIENHRMKPHPVQKTACRETESEDWVRAAKDTYDELHDIWLDLNRK